MASAVYQTKLTADTTQHDQALGKSAKQVYNYKKSCDDADKGVTKMIGGFKKFAGIIGLASIATKTFKGALENSTTAADNYGSMMASVNRITEEFQRSIATMDFSNLFNGLGDLISRANEYYNALDDLQTLQTSLIGDNARLNADLQEARRRFKAGDASAANDLRRIGQQMADNVTAEREALKRELDAYVKSKTGVTVGIHDPDSFLGLGTSGNIKRTAGDFRSMDEIQYLLRHQEVLRQQISKAESEYKNYVRQLEADGNKIHVNWVKAAQLEAEWKSLKSLQEAMGDDEGLKHFEQNYAQFYSLAGEYERVMTRVDQMLSEGSKKTGPTTTRHINVKAELEIPEGSIAEVEKKLQDLRQQYNLATSDEGENGRNALKEKIEEAEEELKKLKGDIEDLPVGSLAQWEKDLKDLRLAWSLATNDNDRAKIKEAMDKIQAEIDRINGKVEIPVQPKTPKQNLQELIDDLRYQLAMADTPELQMKIGFQIDDLVKQMEKLDESLMTPQERIKARIDELKESFEELGNWCSDACDLMSQAMLAFANSNDEAANKTLKSAASIISAIGSAIPKILALVSAEQADAIAGAVASGAKLPFPYNIGAIASVVAQVLSALAPIATLIAQANSFATGGIFDGSGPKYGDMHIARVNPGEMILNNRQQANLFRLLNGNVGPQTGGNNGGHVEFHISGTDLVGVLNNNERKNNRVR